MGPDATILGTDEWTEARRYMGLEFLTKARLRVIDSTTPDPATEQNLLLNLQKQDHAEINSHTTPLNVAVSASGGGQWYWSVLSD